jgi:hypothetical protein
MMRNGVPGYYAPDDPTRERTLANIGMARRGMLGNELQDLGTGGYNPEAAMQRLAKLHEAGRLFHPDGRLALPIPWDLVRRYLQAYNRQPGQLLKKAGGAALDVLTTIPKTLGGGWRATMESMESPLQERTLDRPFGGFMMPTGATAPRPTPYAGDLPAAYRGPGGGARLHEMQPVNPITSIAVEGLGGMQEMSKTTAGLGTVAIQKAMSRQSPDERAFVESAYDRFLALGDDPVTAAHNAWESWTKETGAPPLVKGTTEALASLENLIPGFGFTSKGLRARSMFTRGLTETAAQQSARQAGIRVPGLQQARVRGAGPRVTGPPAQAIPGARPGAVPGGGAVETPVSVMPTPVPEGAAAEAVQEITGVGMSPALTPSQGASFWWTRKSMAARETADRLIREGGDENVAKALKIYEDSVKEPGNYLRDRLQRAGFGDVVVEPNLGRFFGDVEPSWYVKAAVAPQDRDQFIRAVVDAADVDLQQSSVMVHQPVALTERYGTVAGTSATPAHSIEPFFQYRTGGAEITAKQYMELSRIADDHNIPGFSAHADRQGLDMLHVSAYSDDVIDPKTGLNRYDTFIDNVIAFEKEVYASSITRGIIKEISPGTRRLWHYGAPGDGAPLYDDFRRYYEAKTGEDTGFIGISPRGKLHAARGRQEAWRLGTDPAGAPGRGLDLAGGRPPPTDIPTPGTGARDGGGFPPTSRVVDMLHRNAQPEKLDLYDAYRQVQEWGNDVFWGLRTMAAKVQKGKPPILAGGSRDLISMITNHPGAVNAASTRYEVAVNEIRSVAKGIDPVEIDAMLVIAHGQDVLRNKGARRVLTQGIKTEGELIDELRGIMQRIGPEDFERAREAAGIVRKLYKEERERFVHAGLMTRETADHFDRMYPWYNPTRYLEFIEETAPKGHTSKGFTVSSNDVRRLAERGSEGDIQGPLVTLSEQLIKNEVRLRKNEIAKTIVMLAKEAGETVTEIVGKPKRPTGQKKLPKVTAGEPEDVLFSDVPGTLSYMENGRRRVFKVPDWVYREAVTMSQITSNPISTFVGGLNGISKAAFTTFSPVFVAANFLNDMLVAGVTRGIMPHQSAASLLNIVRGVSDDPIYQSFRLAGGFQARFFGGDATKAAARMGLKPGQVITNNTQWKRALLDAVPRAGEALEQAPRIALFRREIKKTLPNWKTMTPEQIAATPQARKAAADAVELTINFARGGFLIKHANPYILFLNASMEGTKIPFRALRANPKARMRMAGVMTGSAALTAYNLSYPEYMDIPDDLRWGSVVVMLPSKEKDDYGRNIPNYVTVVPRTREFGLFLAPVTFAMEKMFAGSPQEFGHFTRVLAPQTTPMTAVTGGMAPQVIAELFEQGANWDFYRSRPVVPTELQSLPAGEQVTAWTSRTMQEIGEKVGLSPLRLEHAARAIGGGVTGAALSATDFIINTLLPPEVNPRAQELARQGEAIEDPTERRAFMMSLTNEERADVEELRRQPDPQIPFVTPFMRRVKPTRRGQIRKTAETAAAKASGLDVEDTKKAAGDLADWSKTALVRQVDDDTALKDGSIDAKTWRANRRDRGKEYQGALALVGANYPRAAQVADDEASKLYYTTVAKVSESLADDDVSRRQVLMTGWYAITPPLTEEDREDWHLFFSRREEYRGALSEQDQEILDAEIASRNTPTEREYGQALEEMKEYLNTEYTLAEALQSITLSDYKRWRLSTNRAFFEMENPEITKQAKIVEAMTRKVKVAMRMGDARLEMALLKWGMVTTIKNQALLQAAQGATQ